VLLLIDLLGWLGGLLVAGGYALVSTRRIAPESTVFQGMNVLGALLLGTACLTQGSLPSAVLNAVWFTVGIRSLLWRPTLCRHPQPHSSTSSR